MRKCIREENLRNCPCTYEPCDKKGICCECIAYHWKYRELPACLFPAEVEKTYDRSLRKFIQVYSS